MFSGVGTTLDAILSRNLTLQRGDEDDAWSGETIAVAARTPQLTVRVGDPGLAMG